MISGRRRLSAYEKVVNQKPGMSSSVMAAPPTCRPALEDQRLEPALARYAPLTMPLWPAPMTIASYVRSAADGVEVFGVDALRSAFLVRLSSSCQAVFRAGL